jgi:hypothetical protein
VAAGACCLWMGAPPRQASGAPSAVGRGLGDPGWPTDRHLSDLSDLSDLTGIALAGGAWLSGPDQRVVRTAPTTGLAGVVMDFTVVCDAPLGCVFDLARRKAPEHYELVASYRWWGSSGVHHR